MGGSKIKTTHDYKNHHMISGVCKSSEWKIKKCCKKIKIKFELGKLQSRVLKLGKKIFPKCKCESMQIEETIEYLLSNEWIVPFDGRCGQYTGQ